MTARVRATALHRSRAARAFLWAVSALSIARQIDAASEDPATLSQVGITAPMQRRWGFETLDAEGKRELFGLAEVPIVLAGRDTQRHWVQRFGRRASITDPDRFPRDPLIVATNAGAFEGYRSLRLRTRGDHALVSLREPIAVTGGTGVLVRAHVRTAGLREGALFLQVRVLGESLPRQGVVLSTPPLRGFDEWTAVVLREQIPDQATELYVEIRLEGGYRDGDGAAWVDDVSLELSSGLRVDWRRPQTVLDDAETSIPFQLEARGLERGVWRAEIEVRRTSLSAGADPTAPALQTVSRFVGDSAEPGAPSLRVRGDLCTVIGARLEPGIYDALFRVRGPFRTPDDPDVPSVELSQRLVVLASGGERPSAPFVRFGWLLDSAEAARGDHKLLESLPRTFPLHDLVWDLESAPFADAALELPAAVRLKGDTAHLPWRGRITAVLLKSVTGQRLLKEWGLALRDWVVLGETRDPLVATAIEALARNGVGLNFGVKAEVAFPVWARFRELSFPRSGSGEPATPPSVSPDWTIVDVASVRGRDSVRGLSLALLDALGAGHQWLIVRGLRGAFFDHDEHGGDQPTATLLAWQMVGRTLERARRIEDLAGWDPEAKCVAVAAAGGDALLTVSRGDDVRTVKRWTGVPLTGEDFLGGAVNVPFDAKSGESTILVAPYPILYSGLNLDLFRTLGSLERTSGSIEPVERWQPVEFRLRNPTGAPLSIEARLAPPVGWAAEAPAAITLAPGGEGVLAFRVRPAREAAGEARLGLVLAVQKGSEHWQAPIEKTVPVESRWIRLRDVAVEGTPPRLGFTIENLSGRAYVAQIDSRVSPLGRDALVASWQERIPPGGSRRLALPLDAAAENLDGAEAFVSAEVSGRPDTVIERVKLVGTRDGIAVRRQ